MSHDPQREWSPEEWRALKALRREVRPRASLEGRVIDELRRRGLLRDPKRAASARRWLAAAAIFVVGVLSGALLIRTRDAPTEGVSADRDVRARYILLLYENEGYRDPPSGRETERVAEYVSWIDDVAAGGQRASGAELSRSGTLLIPGEGADSPRSIPGTSDSALGTLTGYFMVEASDLEQATKIASTCPHLRYGGSISVRRLEG